MKYLIAICLVLAPLAVRADESPINFSLPDVRTGKPVSLSDFKDRKAVAVVFIGTACPINTLYAPTLVRLAREYDARGVQFVAINSNKVDTAGDVAEFAKHHQLSFPVLKDSQNKVADLFGAKRTPEAFVLSPSRIVLYRGRIDDQYGYDFRRAQPTQHDLKEAINHVLQGNVVAKPRTEVAGCLISRVVPAKAGDASVVYTRDVAPILQKHCQECHRPGQIGPFSLLTFEQAEGWAAMIKEVVTEKRMPPWFADAKVGHFLNDRTMPARDRDTLLAWIDQGCAKGNDRDMPEPVKWPKGWRIGTPDVIFEMPKPFNIPAEMPKGGIEYQYFVIDTNFTEDKWVERAEARAGAEEVVHHIIAFIVPPRNSTDPVPEGPPLLPPFVPEARKATVLCGVAPGDMPTILRPGYAKRVPKGAKIVLQMHYTPNGRAQTDRSRIGLIFAKEPPKRQVITVPIMQYAFEIPAGAAHHRVESQGPWDLAKGPKGFRNDVEIMSFMPHMHLRGKDFAIEAIYPDGKREPLLNVPKFNFNWQNAYRLVEPKKLPKGTIIHCTAHFDNSDQNPNNPDPTKRVRWGDQTWQEMMIGWTDYAIERK